MGSVNEANSVTPGGNLLRESSRCCSGPSITSQGHIAPEICFSHIPFVFIATDEKDRTSRLATMLAVVAWYFLK